MTDQRVEERPRTTTDRIADLCRNRSDEVDDEVSFLLRRAASIIEHQSEQLYDCLMRLEAAEAVVGAAREASRHAGTRGTAKRLRTALEEYEELIQKWMERED